MSVRIQVDRDACDGFSNCVAAAPDIFDLGDDDLVVLKLAEVEDDRAEEVRRAANDCPTSAITHDADD